MGLGSRENTLFTATRSPQRVGINKFQRFALDDRFEVGDSRRFVRMRDERLDE